ncbi:MAG: hypothetical protein ACTHWA_06255 [Arachnia sp.]
MSARPNIVLGVVAALVVALAIVAAVVSTGREHPTLDAATPEGVVQLYASALFNDDVSTAEAYLDPAIDCGEYFQEYFISDTSRIVVLEAETDEDTARVDLQIEEGSGIDGTWTHRESFTLRREADTWLITGNPWPFFECK